MTVTPTLDARSLAALTAAHRKRSRPARGIQSARGEALPNGLRVRLSEDPTRLWIPEEARSHLLVPGVLGVTSPDYNASHPPERGGPGFEITLTEHELDNNRLVSVQGHLRDASDGSPKAAITMQGVVDIRELDAFLAGLAVAIGEARERLSLADPLPTTTRKVRPTYR
jgi:hypothetical protein